MDTFNYQPTYSARLDEEPRILSSKFGDGYEQRAGDGINTIVQRWSVTFIRAYAEIDTIIGLFRGWDGRTPFLWTPPRGSGALQFICKKWSRGFGRKADTLEATFEQNFDP
jgi:phage-related protein